MKSLVRWAIQNTPAMNTLMVSIMAVGAMSLYFIHREVFPEFELEWIHINVPYPGANPEEVEEGICQKIEEAVQSVDGIKKLMSVAREGAGAVLLELESDVPDVQKVLNEVRSEVDRIPSFPDLAEDPVIKQITLRHPAINVGVIGPASDDPDAEVALRDVTEKIRNELLQLPSISQAKIVGGREYQIDIEISEHTLRKYGLTLQEVARIVRRENIELPGGSMKTDSQEVLLRGKSKGMVGEEIAKIPLVTQSGGVVLTIGDLGVVRDEFVDITAVSRINGRPGLAVSIEKTAGEDLLAMVAEVHDFIDSVGKSDGYQLPDGYELRTWADRSVIVYDRLELLGRNGLQGLILVFIVLAVFLELRLAFWVALGIPISILGGCWVLLAGGQTLNMLSMFAFLMALGILVDDAIVVGENIYAHRQLGKKFIEAAVDGTYEVMPAVVASVSTTIIAFTPLLFVPGVMGKFIAVMPLAVIAMLIISLIECMFILPCHLAHKHRAGVFARIYRFWQAMPLPVTLGALLVSVAAAVFILRVPLPRLWEPQSAWYDVLPEISCAVALLFFAIVILLSLSYPLKRLGDLFAGLNALSERGLSWLIGRVYLPMLRASLNNPAITFSLAAAVLLVSFGLIRAGITPFVAFPKLDVDFVRAIVVYPDGTPASVTDAATRRIEKAIAAIRDDYVDPETGEKMPLVKIVNRTVGSAVGDGSIGPAGPGSQGSGSHVGSVGVELVPTDQRTLGSAEIVAEWRMRSGEFPGAESVSFGTAAMGPSGTPIELKFLALPHQMADIEQAVEKCKDELKQYLGVFDITDDSRPGKWEFQIRVKDKAKAMGITNHDLAGTVRAAYYGEEVMRLQRGRHEVKLMVRYPRDQRRSLADFDEIRVRTGGAERPLTELAQIDVRRGYSEINRLDQLRSITITADVDEAEGNAQKIISDLKTDFIPRLLEQYPGLRVSWEGQHEQTVESIIGLVVGLLIALVAMFALLTLEFRSYVQPLLVLLIIPFGLIGAVIGHMIMRMPLTLFSLFGIVALSGVVINDSIVLIDFINRRVRSGIPLRQALLDAGRRRFRPVLLTSLTTIVGLLPILTETSLQAQVVIPMATSLCFGLMFATILVLVLVPTFYLAYARITGTGVRDPDVESEAEARLPSGDLQEQLPAPAQTAVS